MKKLITVLLCVAVCGCIFGGCAKKNNAAGNTDLLQPTTAIDIEKLQPDEDFVGDYKNDDYTAHIEKNENDEMVITITSVPKDGIGYEWVITGYFANETYRVNYSDAVKSVITFNKKGAEKSRKEEYNYGAGRIQFSDDSHFEWHNSVERLEGSNQFAKQ